MGGILGSTGSYSRIYHLSPDVRCWKTRFEILKLTESEVGQLYQVFINVDIAEKNKIDTSNLTAYLKVEKNLFAKRMLSSFKKGVRFEGFLFEVWNLCTIDETELAAFVFNLYDLSQSGDITAAEAQTMLLELFGEQFFKDGSRRSKEVMSQLYGSEDAVPINQTQFKDFTRSQLSVLFLAFTVQKSIIAGIVGKGFWAKQLRKKKSINIETMDIIIQLREDVLTGKCRLSDNEVLTSQNSPLPSGKRKVGKLNSTKTVTRENSEKNLQPTEPLSLAPSEMSPGVMMKVEKAKLIFKKGSKRRQQVDAEVAPATFMSDRKGTKRDSVENGTFNEENTVMKKGEKNASTSSDANATDVSSNKRRTSLHKLDRKLESSIAAGTLKPSLKYQNSDADILNDKDFEGMIKASFVPGFTSNDKKSLMASNTIKNSLKSEFVTPIGILSKAIIKGKDGKIVPGAVRMTVTFDLPDHVEEGEYKADEDFTKEIHFS
mmetsp:Transcript_31726/g.30243  ORF Transcript_31726/g.30243 Transcript_31726/m.30243 type:complete len:489 (+) Transcript_31726:335-1801(+)